MAWKGGGLTFEIQGAKELDRMLSELPKAMSKAVLRKALVSAGEPIRAEAETMAPRGRTGKLKKSIVVSTRLRSSQKKDHRRDRTAVEVFVGSTAPCAHLVEFGTGDRSLRTPGPAPVGGNVLMVKSTGRMQPKPFLRPAWEMRKKEALQVLSREIWAELLKAAKRLAKKAEKGTLGKRQQEALRR